MTQWEKIIELLEKLVTINAEISNQNLDIITALQESNKLLDTIRSNTFKTSKNTYEQKNYR